MRASKAGTCSVCGRPYDKGQNVRADPDNPTKLAHVLCGRRAARNRRENGEQK